jgi:hypothetical protein
MAYLLGAEVRGGRVGEAGDGAAPHGDQEGGGMAGDGEERQRIRNQGSSTAAGSLIDRCDFVDGGWGRGRSLWPRILVSGNAWASK